MIIIASLFAAIIPMASYAVFIWWLDRYEREPFKLILANFFWGAFGSIMLVFIFHGLISSLINNLFFSGVIDSGTIDTVVVAPVVEEITKGLFLLFMMRSKEFDNITDGAVYGGSIGLGFGMTENFIYFVSYGTDAVSWMSIVIIRSLFSAVMHSMATAIFGATLGYAKFKTGKFKFVYPIFGLLIAMFMHANWNGLVSFHETYIFGIIFIILSVITIFVLFQISLSIESRIIKSELSEEYEIGFLNKTLLDVIPYTSKRNRRGWIDESKRKKVISLCTDLAFKKSSWRTLTDSKKKSDYENEIIKLRTDILKTIL